MVFVEKVSVEFGKRETLSFVMVNLFSRLMVANCPTGSPTESVNTRPVRLVIVDELQQGGLEAEPQGRVWSPPDKTDDLKREGGPWLLSAQCSSLIFLPVH